MDDKDNANPTILNASDLPSRRNANLFVPRPDGSTGLFDGLVSKPSYLSDPFDAHSSDSSNSDDDELDEVEDIDEQEIYGMPLFS